MISGSIWLKLPARIEARARELLAKLRGTGHLAGRNPCGVAAASTGTNNIAPADIDGTVAGTVSGVLATGAIPASEVVV